MSVLMALALWGLAAALCWPWSAGARAINVPSEFPTIQEAVEFADEGDTVLVGPGTYSRVWAKTLNRPGGNVLVKTNVLVDRPVVLVSEAGAGATVIQGTGLGPVIVVSGARGVVIRGFTIRGGIVDETVLDGGGGVFCELCEVEISENVIELNSAPFGAGVACFNVYSFWIHDNVISENEECEFGGGLALSDRSSGTVEFNVIAQNRANVYGGAVMVNDQSSAIVYRNTIASNHATSGSAVFCRDGGDVVLSRNIIANGTGGAAVYCDTLSSGLACTLELSCNDFWDNQGPNSEGCAFSIGNRTTNPLFCSKDAHDYSVCAFSPSLRGGDECGRRGALPFGCLDCPVQERGLSWGFLKSFYR